MIYRPGGVGRFFSRDEKKRWDQSSLGEDKAGTLEN